MQDFQTKIEVFADIPSHWLYMPEGDAGSRAENAIADFTSLSGLVSLKLWNGKCTPIQIEAFDKLSCHKHFSKIQKKRASRIALPRTFIRLSATINYTASELEQLIKNDSSTDSAREWTMEERTYLYVDMACREFHSFFMDLYLALSIAHPGAIYFWECWQFANESFLRGEHGAMTSFDFARERAEKLKWPEIHTLNMLDAYEWLTKVPGFSDRRGVGPVGRAIAALSYLIKMKSKDENELSLVWALLGLEALFGQGNVGLKAQLLEKSEALLGPRHENKKVFGKMYDFRSRLLHGDVDLLYQHNLHDADPAYEKIWDELYECEQLATAILLSTLQNLCRRNSYSLEFEYTLR
jgi:hypothetical protein